jgi:hypothetical protein
MKISLPNCGLGVSLEDRRVAWCIVSSICFLVGSLGIFLLKNHFRLLPILVLGIASILLGGRASALLSWSKVNREEYAPAEKNLPQITSEWDYRPREATQRCAAIGATQAGAAETLTASPSTVSENDVVWFNFNPPVEDGIPESALFWRRMWLFRSIYDLSPIDNQRAAAE